MYLSAITIGYAIPNKNFDATVHSVFQSALNLRLDKTNKLITLVFSSEADLPQGIRVNAPDGFSFEKFRVGEQVTCRDKNLRLDSLTVDLSSARRWQCDLSALKADTTSQAFASAWNFVWQALSERQKNLDSEIVAEELLQSCRCERALRSNLIFSGDASIGENKEIASSGRTPSSQRYSYGHKISEAMRDLVRATQQNKLNDPSAIQSLIGLGSGLTPSGDDILVGYVAGLWCTVKNKIERKQFVAELGKRIIRLSKETNDISATYLFHATHGQVSSRLENLAEAICNGKNSKQLIKLAEVAMQSGHTSGMDAVTGLLCGLVAWDGTLIEAG